MNPTALAIMAAVVVGWTTLAGAALYAGLPAALAFLVLVVVGLLLYVPWMRLRADEIAGPSLPKRAWANAAMLTVAGAACAALAVAVARWTGFL